MFLDSVYYVATIDSSIVNEYAKMSSKAPIRIFLLLLCRSLHAETTKVANEVTSMCAGIEFVTVSNT
jgi:hypothetical protein